MATEYTTVYVTSNGAPQAGLTLTWLDFKRESDGTALTQPVFTDRGNGKYTFPFDAAANGTAIGTIDASAAIATPGERYVPVRCQASGTSAEGTSTGSAASAATTIPLSVTAGALVNGQVVVFAGGAVGQIANAAASPVVLDAPGLSAAVANGERFVCYASPLPTPLSTVATAVWDEPTSSHTVAGSFGLGLSNVPTAVWAAGTRTLTSFGTLAADAATAVWAAGTRSLTTFGTLTTDTATAVWAAGARTLTGFGTLAGDVWDQLLSGHTVAGSFGAKMASLAADVWAATTRALTDKAGFSIAGTKQTLDALHDAPDLTTTVNAIDAKTTNLPASPASTSDVTTAAAAVHIAGVKQTLDALHDAPDLTTTVNAINAKTANLPAAPAATSDVTSAQTALSNAIAALNNLSSAQAQAAATAALNGQQMNAAWVSAVLRAAITGGGGGKILRAVSTDPFTVYALDGTTVLGTLAITRDASGNILTLTPA